ncbi:hypothetical protein BV25DRAFT_1799105 [Artomyces pyxidatus]|uniref:Uncharacterized protein n=1 Tax=Artomyces pyxidatus TaxID=48021 RepID=A0ACB8TAN6_9AGAM|nr:hypothetical protein BV25DRAFT_1799105 [Artomyces pyxidatus]
MAPEPFSTPPFLSQASTSSAEPTTPAESVSMDRIWDEVRKQNERAMAKSPSKIKSLEVATHSIESSPQAGQRTHAAPQLRKQKSQVTFKDSPDGCMVKATFDLPGVKKDRMHVSYRVDRLIVTWKTIKVTEREEDGKVLRDREESNYSRTIPLPAGTKFEDIEAFKEHPGLVITYPKLPRTVRGRPRRGDALRNEPPP